MQFYNGNVKIEIASSEKFNILQAIQPTIFLFVLLQAQTVLLRECARTVASATVTSTAGGITSATVPTGSPASTVKSVSVHSRSNIYYHYVYIEMPFGNILEIN